MKVKLLYRCLRCGSLIEKDHASQSATLMGAMEAVILLAKLENAGLKERHECGAGQVGVMDLIGGDLVAPRAD